MFGTMKIAINVDVSSWCQQVGKILSIEHTELKLGGILVDLLIKQKLEEKITRWNYVIFMPSQASIKINKIFRYSYLVFSIYTHNIKCTVKKFRLNSLFFRLCTQDKKNCALCHEEDTATKKKIKSYGAQFRKPTIRNGRRQVFVNVLEVSRYFYVYCCIDEMFEISHGKGEMTQSSLLASIHFVLISVKCKKYSFLTTMIYYELIKQHKNIIYTVVVVFSRTTRRSKKKLSDLSLSHQFNSTFDITTASSFRKKHIILVVLVGKNILKFHFIAKKNSMFTNIVSHMFLSSIQLNVSSSLLFQKKTTQRFLRWNSILQRSTELYDRNGVERGVEERI